MFTSMTRRQFMRGAAAAAAAIAIPMLAGARVIANTLRTELPEGFQKAEFLLENGFIDHIVPRKELRSEIARLIDYCEG